MKALYKLHSGKDGVALREVETPLPGAGEVRIKIAYVGICGTDLHIIRDEYAGELPVVMGHEYSGVIDQVGENVHEFQEGDRVVSITAAKFCGKCRYCEIGLNMLCEKRKSIGSFVDGAMAEYMVIDAARVYHLSNNIPIKEAALCEPVACCVRSVIETSSIRAGDYVYVSGPGAIGQITAQLAKLCGAHVTVGGTNIDKSRLELAKQLGADEIIDVTACDARKQALKITKGDLFDLCYECAGAKPSADTCLNLLKKTGEYVQVGLFGKPVPFDMDLALMKENHIVNSFASEPSSWRITLRLMERGKLVLDPLISEVFPLLKWEDAVKKAMNKEGYKILMKPNDDVNKEV